MLSLRALAPGRNRFVAFLKKRKGFVRKIHPMAQFLGLPMPKIPSGYTTEHFTNADLNEMCAAWGGGNTMNDPTHIGRFAERVFSDHQTDREFFADPDVKMMWRDGLGNFLIAVWVAVEKKRGREVNLNEENAE